MPRPSRLLFPTSARPSSPFFIVTSIYNAHALNLGGNVHAQFLLLKSPG